MLRLRRDVYLDNNASTKPSKSVIAVVRKVLSSCWGNPSSLYKTAHPSAMLLDDSREAIARAINAEPEEIIFTGNATEANNTVIKGICDLFSFANKNIVSLPIEHPSVMSTLDYVRSKGTIVKFLPVDAYGMIKMESVSNTIDTETGLICCMMANNETGVVQNLRQLRAVAGESVLILSDCVQAFGKIPVDVKDLGIDYATFSAHKIHGPKGIGVLYVRSGAPFSMFMHGGHQEKGRRAGTESVHNIAGFAQAAKNIDIALNKEDEVRSLSKYFVSQLRSKKPDIILNAKIESKDSSLPNTLSITFPGIDNALLLSFLDYHGISVSAGSACNTPQNKPSHVLTSIGLSDEAARQTLRFSLSHETTKTDIDYAIAVLEEYFSGKSKKITMVKPSQLDESMLFDPANYILDVRFDYERKDTRGLPNSHEAGFFAFSKYASQVPKNKRIIVVCQGGMNAPIIAYYLYGKGYKNVSFLLTGLMLWRRMFPELYEKHCGKDITKLSKL